MTSVVMPTASANPSAKNPATSTFLQPSLGVMPILPKSGESGRSSSGPKHASPRDRKSVVKGKSVDLGGRRIIKKKKKEVQQVQGRPTRQKPRPQRKRRSAGSYV